jgi:hypothetical protein
MIWRGSNDLGRQEQERAHRVLRQASGLLMPRDRVSAQRCDVDRVAVDVRRDDPRTRVQAVAPDEARDVDAAERFGQVGDRREDADVHAAGLDVAALAAVVSRRKRVLRWVRRGRATWRRRTASSCRSTTISRIDVAERATTCVRELTRRSRSRRSCRSTRKPPRASAGTARGCCNAGVRRGRGATKAAQGCLHGGAA